MDLQDIKQKKSEVEQKISKLIETFVSETGVVVTDIKFGVFNNFPMGSRENFSGTLTKLDIDINWNKGGFDGTDRL